MGKSRGFKKQAAALGFSAVPRFKMPEPEVLAKRFKGRMTMDFARMYPEIEQLKALKPSRRALEALLSRKTSVQDVRVIRDNFIPIAMQHDYCIAIDAAYLDISDMEQNLSQPVPEAWPHGLRHAYICLQEGYGCGAVLKIWVEQLQEGRSVQEKKLIIFNMAKALSASEGYEYEE